MGSWFSQNTTVCMGTPESATIVVSITTQPIATVVYICENKTGRWDRGLRPAASKRKHNDSEYVVDCKIRRRFERGHEKDGAQVANAGISGISDELALCACDTREEI